MEPRQMGNWCWAAAAKSIAAFYDPGNALTQGAIAKDVCGSADPLECDVPKRLSDTLKVTGNYVNHFEGTIEWEKIKSEIEANRIVCARVKWPGGGGHFVAIYGVAKTESTELLYVDDPLLGQSFIPYEEFRVNYHSSGSWSHTYFTSGTNAM